jgi:hypothetical protein
MALDHRHLMAVAGKVICRRRADRARPKNQYPHARTSLAAPVTAGVAF